MKDTVRIYAQTKCQKRMVSIDIRFPTAKVGSTPTEPKKNGFPIYLPVKKSIRSAAAMIQCQIRKKGLKMYTSQVRQCFIYHTPRRGSGTDRYGPPTFHFLPHRKDELRKRCKGQRNELPSGFPADVRPPSPWFQSCWPHMRRNRLLNLADSRSM